MISIPLLFLQTLINARWIGLVKLNYIDYSHQLLGQFKQKFFEKCGISINFHFGISNLREGIHSSEYNNLLFDNNQIVTFEGKLEVNNCQFINHYFEKGAGSAIYTAAPTNIQQSVFFNCKSGIGIVYSQNSIEIHKSFFTHTLTSKEATIYVDNHENFIFKDSCASVVESIGESVAYFSTSKASLNNINISNCNSQTLPMLYCAGTTNSIDNLIMYSCISPTITGIIFNRLLLSALISGSTFCKLSTNPLRNQINSSVIFLGRATRVTCQYSKFIDLELFHCPIIFVEQSALLVCERCAFPVGIDIGKGNVELKNENRQNIEFSGISIPSMPTLISHTPLPKEKQKNKSKDLILLFLPAMILIWGVLIAATVSYVVLTFSHWKRSSRRKI